MSTGQTPYCFPRLMGCTSTNEHVLVGHKVPRSQLNWKASLSDTFNDTRFTANISSSLKAMTVPQRMVFEDCVQEECVGDTLSELEQQLLQEQNKAKECLEDIGILWKQVLSQEIL